MYLVENKDTGERQSYTSIQEIKQNCPYIEDKVYLRFDNGSTMYIGNVADVISRKTSIEQRVPPRVATSSLIRESKIQKLSVKVKKETTRNKESLEKTKSQIDSAKDDVLDAFNEKRISLEEMQTKMKELNCLSHEHSELMKEYKRLASMKVEEDDLF